jgi:hypothetical protein
VKFFPSIDHDILKDQFRQRIKDRRVLALLDVIVDGSNEQDAAVNWFPGDTLLTPWERARGLPIGNLTSQWFANWYLTGFDHRATSVWRVGGYVRYCDDFVLLDGSRDRLRALVPAVVDALGGLRLRLHLDRIRVAPSRAGRVFVGFRIGPHFRRLRNAAVRNFLTRLGGYRRAFRAGHLTRADVQRRLMGWVGHAGQADTLALLAKLSREWVFRDGQFVRFGQRGS